MRLLLVGGVSLLAAAGCEIAGACEHTYRDPVLAVDVAAAGSGQPLTASLFTFRVAGHALAPDPSWVSAPAYGAQLRGDSIVCAGTCGFGYLEGRYQFIVAVPGFEDSEVNVVGAYAAFDGGCPSSNSGSTHVRVDLGRASGLR
jgi:hypothetical protein